MANALICAFTSTSCGDTGLYKRALLYRLKGLLWRHGAVLRKIHSARWLHMQYTMGCLPLVGSLKLQDSFAEYRLLCRSLLQKRRILLRSLLLVATPYIQDYTYM